MNEEVVQSDYQPSETEGEIEEEETFLLDWTPSRKVLGLILLSDVHSLPVGNLEQTPLTPT